MAKVYNKKKNMYKGSIPGMKMGGTLRKAQYGNGSMDEDIYTLGTDTLGNPIEGSPKPVGNKNTMTEADLENKIDSLRSVLDENVNRRMSTENLKYEVADSLNRDQGIKDEIAALQKENDYFDRKDIKDQLEIACMRGDTAACKELGFHKTDIRNKNIRERIEMDEMMNPVNQAPTMKKGGTVLGGKYKMKKGGSLGRNGIL
jgi:hypothetical protein